MMSEPVFQAVFLGAPISALLLGAWGLGRIKRIAVIKSLQILAADREELVSRLAKAKDEESFEGVRWNYSQLGIHYRNRIDTRRYASILSSNQATFGVLFVVSLVIYFALYLINYSTLVFYNFGWFLLGAGVSTMVWSFSDLSPTDEVIDDIFAEQSKLEKEVPIDLLEMVETHGLSRVAATLQRQYREMNERSAAGAKEPQE